MHIYIFLQSHGNQGKLFLSSGDSYQSPGHNLAARERSRPLVATSPTQYTTLLTVLLLFEFISNQKKGLQVKDITWGEDPCVRWCINIPAFGRFR